MGTWRELPGGSYSNGVTALAGLSDVDVSTQVPTEGDLLKYINGKWKPGAAAASGSGGTIISSSGSTYIVELSKWGIVAGIPSKPYNNAAYTQANNNVVGFNNAIQYAVNNGYTDIVLPRGQYAICYPSVISMASYLTFDFNGSTLKVIYDSDNRSPYDTAGASAGLSPWKFYGTSIAMDNLVHAHIKNLTLIGCRADRSFADKGTDGISGELSMEQTYGISFGNGTRHCSVKHCDISYYMGDNITFSSLPNGTRWAEFSMGLTVNDIDFTTGQLIAATDKLTTMLFTLPAGTKTWAIQGAGYSRATSAYNRHEFDVFYYDASGNYLGVLPKRHFYSPIDVPYNAAKFRVVFFNETNTTKNMGMIFVFGDFNYNNLVEYNVLHDSHRGGLTLGGNHNIVQRNVIKNNGKYIGRMLDGKPAFNDPTRYGINQEDSYGEGSIIRENVIYGSFHGVLMGAYSSIIENNHIYDCDYLAINVYTLDYLLIRGNKIQNCLYNLGIGGNGFSDGFVEVVQNSFYGGMLDIGWTSSPVHYFHFESNNFYNPHGLQDVGSNATFKDNRIRLYLDAPGQHVPSTAEYYDYSTYEPVVFKIPKMDNCVIEGRVNSVFTAKSDATFITDRFLNCKLSNLNATFTTLTDTIKDSEVAFQDCEFNSVFFINHVTSKSRHAKATRSTFNDTIIKISNAGVSTSVVKVSMDKCKVNSTLLDSFFLTSLDQTTGAIDVTDTEFTYSNGGMLNIVRNLQTATNTQNTASFKNSTFTYTGAIPIALGYYNDKNPMKSFVSHNNKFVNVTLPTQDAGIYIGYDPSKQYKKTVTLAQNGSVYEATITHNLNTTEPYVFCAISNQIIYPTVTVIDANNIKVSHTASGTASIAVSKFL